MSELRKPAKPNMGETTDVLQDVVSESNKCLHKLSGYVISAACRDICCYGNQKQLFRLRFPASGD